MFPCVAVWGGAVEGMCSRVSRSGEVGLRGCGPVCRGLGRWGGGDVVPCVAVWGGGVEGMCSRVSRSGEVGLRGCGPVCRGLGRWG